MSIQPISCVVIISTGAVIILLLAYNFYVMSIGNKNIFPGSGAPVSMAQTILNSIQATSQFLFGIFVVNLLLVMIIEKVVTSEVGIPIITSVIGFLLGRTQKKDSTNVDVKPPQK